MKKGTFFRVKCLFTIALACTACSIDIDVSDKTLNSSPFDFNNPEDFSYDANYLEIKDGKVALKPLDLEHAGADFTRGDHVGSSFSESTHRATILIKPDSTELSVQNIISNHNNALVGYWRLDDNVFDSSGSAAHGTSQGVLVFREGQIEKSLELDGTNYIGDIPYIDISGGNYTFAAWVKANDNSGNHCIISASKADRSSQWCLLLTLGRLRWSVPGQFGHFSNDAVPLDDRYHHLVIRFDNGTLDFFLDGRTNGSQVGVPAINFNSGDVLEIGRRAGLEDIPSNDTFDEISIWSTAISNNEIFALYEKQKSTFNELSSSWTPKWENIVGYWKMDGNWQDSSGNGNHGAPINDVNTSSTSYKVGSSSAHFDGDDDRVDMNFTGPPSFGGSYSYALWVKPEAPLHDTKYFRYRNGWDGADLGGNGSGFPTCYHGTLVSNYIQVSATALPEESEWSHMVCSYDISTNRLSLYINGKLKSTGVTAGPLSSLHTTVEVGNDPTNVRDFKGHLDDLAIWSTVLSSSEIQNIYNRQKQKYAGHYDSEVMDLGSPTAAWPDLSWLTRLPFGKELIGDFDNDGIPDSESSSDYSGLSGDLDNGIVGYWDFNERNAGSGPGATDTMDLSGLGNHGTAQGVVFGGEGKLGKSFEFDGINSFVTIPSSAGLNLNPNNDYSVSFWVKIPNDQIDLDVNTNWIVHKENIGPYFYVFTIRTFNSNHGDFGRIQFAKYDGTMASQVISPAAYNDNEWHFILAQLKNSHLELYIDGSLVATTPDLTDSLPLSTGDIEVGDNNNKFMGKIDELAIRNGSLSISQIQQLYRRGANRVNLQVKSCVDSFCNCKSFSLSPAGSVNDCDGDGIANSNDDDDIHQAQFKGPGGDGTTFFSELMNRDFANITFDCDANTSDGNDDICTQDEILLSGSPKPTPPMFSFNDYLDSAAPQPNRYFQYRVVMEGDANTACDGEPCLPELTSVSLSKSDEPRYYGITQAIENQKAIAYRDIQSVSIEADSCVGFQLSPDKENYYFWNGQGWAVAPAGDNRSTASELEAHIVKYSQQFQNGELYFKAFLSSDTTTPCELSQINLNYRRPL